MIASKIVFLYQREKMKLDAPYREGQMLLIKNLNPNYDKQAIVKNSKNY